MSALPVAADTPQLNRVREVRLREGCTLRTAARHFQCNTQEVRRLDNPYTNLTLRELYNWQKLLHVPLEELTAPTEVPLEAMVYHRAQLIRMMKTARTIQQQAKSYDQQQNAENLVGQLLALMPQLAEVAAWPTQGKAFTDTPSQRDMMPVRVPPRLRGWSDTEIRTSHHPTADV